MLVILLSATSTTEYQGIIALKLFKDSNFLFQVDKVEVGDGSTHYLAGTTVRVHVVGGPGEHDSNLDARCDLLAGGLFVLAHFVLPGDQTRHEVRLVERGLEEFP